MAGACAINIASLLVLTPKLQESSWRGRHYRCLREESMARACATNTVSSVLSGTNPSSVKKICKQKRSKK